MNKNDISRRSGTIFSLSTRGSLYCINSRALTSTKVIENVIYDILTLLFYILLYIYP